MSNNSGYAPPPGPPPSYHAPENYAPPADPPPSHSEYAPPPGPPPSHVPQHDWQTAVPDTSLLPPPPSLRNEESSANNASEQDAQRGNAWCEQNRLLPAMSFPQAAHDAVIRGEIGVVRPRTFKGDLERPRPGVWTGKTRSSCPDSCITSALPLYSALVDSPSTTGRSKTIYYEIRIARRNRSEVSLAMGFSAPPYPTFRLPGWHRGSLAVHGDDGNRYVNNVAGGKDFESPFKPGETLGIGMVFTTKSWDAPPGYNIESNTTNLNTEIFFTRNGRKAGSWDLHEEGDEDDLPVTGLEGLYDLYASVGTFEAVDFEILFNPGDWMYRP